ncbi:MAG TPA: universal stress protein [Solirubrobacteraceae bacterium]|nr:universal stress protein [Solirubrobacteraceae bacterium]
MFKRIVWATDGSDSADKALAVAKMLASDSGGELVAVHCEELTLPGKGGGSYPAAANEDDLKSKIERQVSELAGDGVRATLETTRAKVGGAAQAIARVARAHESDAIVVGTRGHTPIGGLLVGSVTQRLLHISPCPVIAVPTRDADGNA